MSVTAHERPGVYSSYDASSVTRRSQGSRVIGIAAKAAKGTVGEVVTVTGYESGRAVFGEDSEGGGMTGLLRLLYENGASEVKAVRVAESGTVSDYTAAFGVLICLWTVTPKHICRMGINPIVAFCAFGAAGGIGAGTGLAVLNALGAEGPHAATACFVISTLFVGVAMVVGFNPAWFFVGHAVNPLSKTRSGQAAVRDDGAKGETPGAQAGATRAEVRTETAPGAGEVGCREDELCPVAVSSATPLGTRAQIEDACLQRAAIIQRRYGLTEREAQIAALLLEGRSRPYICDELVISLNTVHTHARSIYSKCGVHSQREFMELPDEK